MKARRLQQMALYIAEHKSATMEELQTTFDISMNTVRRDLAELVADGSVEKVYGGVRAKQSVSGFLPYDQRSLKPSHAKRAICSKAAELVHDGDIIFIDSGTTTIHLVEALKDRSITIITNNIEVMMAAVDYPSIRLIMLPGELQRSTHSLTGADSAAFLSNFNTNIAFMAATGISDGGVTNSIPLEYEIKKAAIAHTGRAVLMVTGNKFGVTSLLTYARPTDFDRIITDTRISSEWITKMGRLGVTLNIVET